MKAKAVPSLTTFRVVIAAVIALVILIWVFIPFAIRWYLNHQVLADMGQYYGRVQSVKVHLLDGEYRLEQLVIYHKDRVATDPESPFFQLSAMDIGISWSALRKRELLMDTDLYQPELHIVEAKDDDNEQLGEGTNWIEVFDRILPTTVSRLGIHNGVIRFSNAGRTPKASVEITQINALLTNLTNIAGEDGQRVASAKASGKLFDESAFSIEAEFDPFEYDDFVLAAQADSFELSRINTLAQSYANVDFKSGKMQIFCELEAKDRQLKGYIKPLLEDVNIASWSQDVEQQGDNPLQVTWEALWGVLSAVFTNLDSRKLATEIEIEGSLDDTEVRSFSAFIGVIKNAFIDALQTRFNEWTPLTQASESE
ncbi:DUF748 domain-containing protein [Gilvimarinus algae]|uniref:DUF748 domain-containing protein n=1 Tax=Gilvimarinus algae TaxID=3058037 RepID=A0ABT8TE84_9GAMM|nr:DUF748 domain-containing protein [Gilvimarinus sp. SDUM040014]MDO3381698.1 DUF748 domain-containing protein [Gilvimarinus sp. SDUM040014]